jgi:hypothetical protein
VLQPWQLAGLQVRHHPVNTLYVGGMGPTHQMNFRGLLRCFAGPMQYLSQLCLQVLDSCLGFPYLGVVECWKEELKVSLHSIAQHSTSHGFGTACTSQAAVTSPQSSFDYPCRTCASEHA